MIQTSRVPGSKLGTIAAMRTYSCVRTSAKASPCRGHLKVLLTHTHTPHIAHSPLPRICGVYLLLLKIGIFGVLCSPDGPAERSEGSVRRAALHGWTDRHA
jgi:hypothetical protein